MNFLDTVTKITNGTTRLFTAENVYGEKGRGGMADNSENIQPEVARIGQQWGCPINAARELGQGWKVRPSITLLQDTETTILDTDGPGRITHIWMAFQNHRLRDLILRAYWDGESTPSIESPVGDFFCCGWNKALAINALPMNTNATGGMNCFFPMPFRKQAKITIENRSADSNFGFYYAISMDEDSVSDDEGYFHAKFRRTNPVKYGEDYLIIDDIKGRGQYVGTQISWQQNNDGWWGEGEIKMYIDGDTDYPTYCGTGTEDYFGGAWGFYGNFSAPFFGYQDLMTLGENKRPTNTVGNRHSMYRFHLPDPVRFKSDLKVTIQALGWRSEGRYLPLQDDIASVAYWYQTEPHSRFEPLGTRNDLEVK